MADYGVTDQGFVLKRFDTILSEVQKDVSDAVGFDVSQNQQSMLNAALIYPFCDKIAELWEQLQGSYYAKYPATATGINLDNACQYGNVFRQGSKPTEYMIHVKAKDGTVVPKGSLISSATSPTIQLKCVNETTVERKACNKIAIKVLALQPRTAYTIAINDTNYEFVAPNVATRGIIYKGLKDNFKEEGFKVSLVDQDTENEMLLIEDEVLTNIDKFVLSSNLTTDYVVSTVHYYTVENGDFEIPFNVITNIVTNVTGMQSVTNMIDRTEGHKTETDVEFRQSYIAKTFVNTLKQSESIQSYILDSVEEVKDVRVYENYANSVDAMGRPPHSIEVIVDGGDEMEIANAIHDTKAGGIDTYGTVVQTILGEYGDKLTIRFNRPEPIYAWIRVELYRQELGNVDSDFKHIVQKLIVDGSSDMSIGDDFMSQQYISSVYAALNGISYCKIFVAQCTSMDETPVETDYTEGNIKISERQKAIIDSSRIEVILNG